MRRVTRFVLISALSAGFLGSAVAYVLDGGRWDGATTTFYVNIPGSAPSGPTWNTAFEAAMDEWSAATDFNFQIEHSYQDPCQGYRRSLDTSSSFPDGEGDLRNGTDFRPDVCGNDFGAGVLAITLSYSQGTSLGFPNIVESDIIFNSGFNWDVYEGARSQRTDFGRVALHELGHAIGLDHELVNEAIMQPRIADLDALTVDDITGVNALYANSSTCEITDLGLHAVINGALQDGDCQIRDLFNTGSDNSFVDAFRIRLEQSTELHINVSSSVMDPVLLIFTPQLKWLADFDDTATGCNAMATTTLEAGEYLLLVNTYTRPEKCGTNTGPYTLTISDSNLPLLGATRNASGGADLASALFAGGATADGGITYPGRFSASQSIDVSARLGVDPAHQGLAGKIYVVASLSDGRQYMNLDSGKFVPFSGKFATLQPFRAANLAAIEALNIVQGLRGDFTGLRGQDFSVRVGYAVDSHPSDIYYGADPLQFSIDQ